MKLLLDENLPRRLKQDLQEHDVFTVREKGWSGVKNGELLARMIAEGFDALLTFDKNIQHQQNFTKYPVIVLLLTAESNQHKHLHPLMKAVKEELQEAPPGVIVIR